MDAPALWTSWRDRRNGRVVTVIAVRRWGSAYGELRLYCEELPPTIGQPRLDAGIRSIYPAEFAEHFELIYDPYTGWEEAA